MYLCHNAKKQRWQETCMFKTTHTGKDSLAERFSTHSRKQGDRKWHDKCFKVNLAAPVQCYLQDRIMEHDHKQMAIIFPSPVEASLESNETFTYAHELKRWKKAQQSRQNLCVTTSPSSALPPPSTGQPPPLPPVKLALTYVFWENKFL